MPLEVGSVVEGMVTSIASFGAFVQLPEGKTGLVHISEVADHYVEDIKQYLKEKDRIKVKIISIDNKGKISLSLKQAGVHLKKTDRPIEIDWEAERREKMRNLSFEDRMAKFLKDSDEKQQQLRKSQDSKRGGGFRRGEF
jgi:S1 RNA binding domain protein